MTKGVFITCAVTGSGDTVPRHAGVPVTPAQIASAAIESAQAGAAIVHIHVRDPETGKGSRDPELFREVVARIRDSGVDVVLNLTAGMGGDLVLGGGETPLAWNKASTDLAGPLTRLRHVEALLPEICTLDCGTMNFAESDYVMVNTPSMLVTKARRVRELGVRPELEIFDSGHLSFVKHLIGEGLVESPVLLQLCMGIPWGAPADLTTFNAMVQNLPAGAVWSAFSIGRLQFSYVALAAVAGGNVRVGLEDNLYLGKGVKASNPQLVERAVTILSALNIPIQTPAEVREALQLRRFGG